MSGNLGFVLVNADSPLALVAFELDDARGEGEQGVVIAHAHVDARIKLSSALADDDVARFDDFAAVLLDAESLRIGIAAVSC